MDQSDAALIRWTHRRSVNLDKATIGQLVVLLELVNSDSVASIGKSSAGKTSVSAGVNYRQKLARLETALGVGQLTKRVGKVTRPTEAGTRIAGELRLLLNELRSIESKKREAPTWVIGAGELWLTGLIIPALVSLSRSHPQWRWEVQNLRSNEIRSGLREGTLHFGFVRVGDAELGDFTTGTKFAIESYRVVVGEPTGAPQDPKELIRWAIDQGRPLVQQGSTWPALCSRVGRKLGVASALASLRPHLTCETHPQALAAAERGNSWCVVPKVPGLVPASSVRSAEFAAGVSPETMILLNYSRSLKKNAEADEVWEELNRAIRRVANSQSTL